MVANLVDGLGMRVHFLCGVLVLLQEKAEEEEGRCCCYWTSLCHCCAGQEQVWMEGAFGQLRREVLWAQEDKEKDGPSHRPSWSSGPDEGDFISFRGYPFDVIPFDVFKDVPRCPCSLSPSKERLERRVDGSFHRILQSAFNSRGGWAACHGPR